ncbi:MAG TPA: protein kinase [Pirellulales bacterium]|jgi:serine/threonine-protein kinase|nr:protein kinase [Pirellulales bacterium]
MPKSSDDRNLLFGILALQMDFINREQLVAAMNAWVLTKEKPLGQILGDQQALSAERRMLLEALVGEHLKLHGNDPEKSLAAVSSAGAVRGDLQKINDPGLQASLMRMPTAAAPDPYVTVAQTVGAATSSGSRFRIVRPYARGGLGEVFVAQDEELHREVVVKQIQMRHADEQDSRIRFVQEAEITGGLEHPGIVPVYGLGSYADGRPYYAMRFIRGDSLKDAIERFHSMAAKKRSAADRSLELRGLLGRFIDVCDAIEYAHSRGVLHRDLKPGNIMLGKYGETLVVDWGLAKAVDRPELVSTLGESALKPSRASGSAPTQIGSAVGTPQFMSPEQASGRLDQLGAASDVYSLGATLYSLLTGKAAFEDTDLGLVLRKVERGEFPRPSEINKETPPPLEAICLKAMSLANADRYATPRALADELEHWLADEPVVAYREPAGERLARWTRRNRAWAQSIAAAVLLVAVVAVIASLLIARSWREDAAARIEADRGFREARDAVNDYFTQVSENKLLNVPGLQPLRKDLLESALRYYEEFLKEHAGDPTLHSDVALTWYRVGRIEEEIDKNADAAGDLEKAEVIQEEIAKRSSDPAAKAALADTYNALGDLAQQTVKLDDARRWFQQARDLRTQLVDANPADAQLRRKLANSNNNLAVIDGRLGNAIQAKQEYALANDERQKLVAEHPVETLFRRDLAQGRYDLGVLLMGYEKELPTSLDLLRQAAVDFEKLSQEDQRNIKIRGDLAATYRVAGDVEARMGKSAAAMADYEKARQVAEPLARGNPLLSQLQFNVAAIYIHVGELKLRTSDWAEALNQFNRSRGILEQLAVDDPSVALYRAELARCLGKIAAIQQKTGRLADAQSTLDAVRADWQRLVDESPETLDYQSLLGTVQDELAASLWHAGKKQEALALASDATAHLRAAFDKSPNNADYRIALSNNYEDLATFKRNSGKLLEAAALSQERRKLWPRNPTKLYDVAGELALAATAGGSGSSQPAANPSSDQRAIEQQAIEVLQEAVAAGFNKFDAMKADSRFQILAQQPAFKQLLEQGASTASK